MYARPPPCRTQFSHVKVLHSPRLFPLKELTACWGQGGRVQNPSVLIRETFSREKISVPPDRSINYGQSSLPIILSMLWCQESSGPHPSLQTSQNGQQAPPVLTFPQWCSWMTNFSGGRGGPSWGSLQPRTQPRLSASSQHYHSIAAVPRCLSSGPCVFSKGHQANGVVMLRLWGYPFKQLAPSKTFSLEYCYIQTSSGLEQTCSPFSEIKHQ